MTFEEVFDQVKDIKGWMPICDCEVLYNYASKIKNGVIVEIGPYMGRSSKVLCLASPTSQIHSFDSYISNYEYKGGSVIKGEDAKRECLKNMIGIKNWHLHHIDSVEGSRTWHTPIDLLIIDGDHQELSVRLDTATWVPEVKVGHYVLFHDYYHAAKHYVKPAVNALKHLFSERKDYTNKDGIGSMFQICTKK